MKFSILSEADGEAIAAALWYEDQRFQLGDDFLVELDAGFDSIRSSPDSKPILEGYTGPHLVRRQLLRRFPFAIIYITRGVELIVVAVAHTRRRPFYWLGRLS